MPRIVDSDNVPRVGNLKVSPRVKGMDGDAPLHSVVVLYSDSLDYLSYR